MKNDPTLTIVDNGTRQTPAPGKPRDRSKSPTRDKPTRPLPSSRIAFEKQLDILRGYAAGSGPGNNPVSSSDVADIVKVAESSFYLVNPFFCDIGLLQRVEQAGQASKYLPCADVCTFAKAYEWNRETAAYKLAPVIRASWFADALLRKLSFGALEENEAIETLAEKASAGPDYKPQLRLLLNYLESTGLIMRENGVIKMIQSSSVSPTAKEPDQTTQLESKEASTVRSAISTAFVQPTQGVVNFHVDVKINMDELASWSPTRISAFFSGIAQVLAAKGQIEREAGKENQN